MLVRLELYVTAIHGVSSSSISLLYETHASIQSSNVYNVRRRKSDTSPPSSASPLLGQSVKQNCVKGVPSEAVKVRGVVKVQLLAERPTVPEVTGALLVEEGDTLVENDTLVEENDSLVEEGDPDVRSVAAGS